MISVTYPDLQHSGCNRAQMDRKSHLPHPDNHWSHRNIHCTQQQCRYYTGMYPSGLVHIWLEREKNKELKDIWSQLYKGIFHLKIRGCVGRFCLCSSPLWGIKCVCAGKNVPEKVCCSCVYILRGTGPTYWQNMRLPSHAFFFDLPYSPV